MSAGIDRAILYHLCNTQNANFSWLNSVKTILDECGFSYIWETQIFISEVWLKSNIKMRLHGYSIFHALLAVYGLLFEIYIELRNLFRLKYQNIVQS
jgi:hypothetical protein